MAIADTKLTTAEEFYEFCRRPENRDRHFELERGEIEEMSLPGDRHGVVCANASWVLGDYIRRYRKGYVSTNDPGLILERNPDTVRGPDIAFHLESRGYEDLESKYIDYPPTLVIEVLSPNDRIGKVNRRIASYHKMGVKLVWLLDPEARDVTVYHRGREQYVLDQSEYLTGDDVMPEFRVLVEEFFNMMPVEGDQS